MSFAPEIIAVVFGLASAFSWGTGDFAGGFASKRVAPQVVVLLSHIIGAAFLVGLALFFDGGLPPASDLWLGALSGLFGLGGILALYHGAAIGRMGVVAPLSALLSAILPVSFSFWLSGLPSTTTLLGIGVALIAVWLISSNGEHTAVSRKEIIYGLSAGLGFGLFFVFLSIAGQNSVYWPLVAGRLASIAATAVWVYLAKLWTPLTRRELFPIAVAGVMDAAGNSFFVLATRFGRIDIAAILASLYPAVTIMFARVILDERLVRLQWIGVGLALIALVLIAI